MVIIVMIMIVMIIMAVYARLAQLVRSLTANHEVPGSIPGLVEGWTFSNLLSPHHPWTETLCHWSSLLTFYWGIKKNPRTGGPVISCSEIMHGPYSSSQKCLVNAFGLISWVTGKSPAGSTCIDHIISYHIISYHIIYHINDNGNTDNKSV